MDLSEIETTFIRWPSLFADREESRENCGFCIV